MSLKVKLAMLASVAVLSAPAMAWESANDGGRLRHFTNTIDLNMRAWPAPVSQIVATLPQGSQMSADRCIHPEGLQDDWCHVVSASSTGWVDAAYLQEIRPGDAGGHVVWSTVSNAEATKHEQAAADAAAAAKANAEAARLTAEANAAKVKKDALDAQAAADAAAAAKANAEAARLTAEANAAKVKKTPWTRRPPHDAAAAAKAAADDKAKHDAADARLKADAEAAKQWGMKVDEARTRGTKYAEAGDTKWSLSEIDNPMIDDKDYSVTSVQLNKKGAVAKIEGTCRSPGQVTFVATLGDNEDPNSPLGLPDFAAGYVAGNKRINDDVAFPTRFQSPKFRNTIQLATLTSQHTADSIETTWRVLAEVETARGRLIMQIPTFDANVQKLLVACGKQYESAKKRGGLLDAPTFTQ